MKKLILFLFLIGLLSSCKTPVGFQTCVVPAGENPMKGNRFTILKKTYLNFTVQTDSSWVWDIPEKNGYSKVIGVGFQRDNEKNRVSLVYINRKNNVHQFAFYAYKNGISPQMDKDLKKVLIDVEIGKAYSGKVGYVDGWYYVEVGGVHHSIKASGTGVPYLLNPYIGGTYTIDHDWIVKLKYY